MRIIALLAALAATLGLPAFAQNATDKAACTSSGQVWHAERCLPFPSAMIGDWVFVASYYPLADEWDVNHARFDETRSEERLKIFVEFDDGALFLASSKAPNVGASLLWEGFKSFFPETGIGRLRSFSGGSAGVYYVPAGHATDNHMLEDLMGNDFGTTDWLVVDGEELGEHYFTRPFTDRAGPAGPVDEFQRPAGDDCYRVFDAPLKLQKCVTDDSQWSYDYVDQAMPMDTAIRMAFQARVGETYLACMTSDDCAFERALAEAIHEVTATLPFLEGVGSPEAQYQMIEDHARMNAAVAETAAAIRTQADRNRDDLEAILDAFAFDGTEALSTGIAVDVGDQARLQALIEAITFNALCTGGGLAPGAAGPATGIACGAASIVDAVEQYRNAEASSDLPNVARTPTAIDFKRYLQAVVRENEQQLYDGLIRMRDLAYRDTKLAHLMATRNLDRIFLQSPAQRDEMMRAMWQLTLRTLGFLVGDKTIWINSSPLSILPHEEACTFKNAIGETTIATEPFRVLKDDKYVSGETITTSAGALPEFEDLIDSKRYRQVNWEVMVGRPLERRKLSAKTFNELTRLFPSREIYEILKSKRYLASNAQVTLKGQIPADGLSTSPVYTLTVVSSEKEEGFFRLPDAPTQAAHVLSNLAENPSTEPVTLATAQWHFPDQVCFLDRN